MIYKTNMVENGCYNLIINEESMAENGEYFAM